MRETVIVSAVRTPTGKFLGVLKDFRAPDLGAIVVRESARASGRRPHARRRFAAACRIVWVRSRSTKCVDRDSRR
jgi:acetyl-CoA acetyltransferase